MFTSELHGLPVSDSDGELVDPSPSMSTRRSARISARDSPWSPWLSERVLKLLGDRGIPVTSGLLRDDLLLLAASTVGCPLFPFDGVVPFASAAPAQPAKASRKHSAKSSSPPRAKRDLADSVRGLESRLVAIERHVSSASRSDPLLDSDQPSSSAAAILASALSAAPAVSPPPASAVSSRASFSLSTAVPTRALGRPFIPPANMAVLSRLAFSSPGFCKEPHLKSFCPRHFLLPGRGKAHPSRKF
ncbi:hypothetical protein AOLI_G00153920 [Acnodon oligacanthus]